MLYVPYRRGVQLSGWCEVLLVHQRSASSLYLCLFVGLACCCAQSGWAPIFSLSVFCSLSVLYVCRDFSPHGAFSLLTAVWGQSPGPRGPQFPAEASGHKPQSRGLVLGLWPLAAQPHTDSSTRSLPTRPRPPSAPSPPERILRRSVPTFLPASRTPPIHKAAVVPPRLHLLPVSGRHICFLPALHCALSPAPATSSPSRQRRFRWGFVVLEDSGYTGILHGLTDPRQSPQIGHVWA